MTAAILFGIALTASVFADTSPEVRHAEAAYVEVVETQSPTRAARSLARASRQAEAAGALEVAFDLAREAYVLRPTRRGLRRVDALAERAAPTLADASEAASSER